MTEEDLLKHRKRTAQQKRIGVYLSKALSGRKNAEIGAFFGITIQAVTPPVRDVEKR